MHHIFEVDEILRTIATHVVYRGRDHAISFACCCKSFSAPVLDTLWGIYYYDLTRLLRTLPPSVWTITNNTFDFVRLPSEEEWARLLEYSRRMRNFMNHGPVEPSEAAIILLNIRFSNSCMLPNLREIRWLGAPEGHLELVLPLIVSPVLENFRLSLKLDHLHDTLRASQLIPAFKALAPAYNSLVEVHFCDRTAPDPRMIDATSTLLLKCNPNTLRYFRAFSTLSEEALLHAAQLPKLEALSVRTDATELRKPLPPSMFPSLRSLNIQATGAVSPLLQLITRIESKTFSHLELEFPADASATFLPRTLEGLRSSGFHQTLTVLNVSPEGRFDVDAAFIRPLLFLKQLTRLEIVALCGRECPYKLSDNDLEELVSAMPKLKELHFGWFPCTHPANNTIKSLVSVAKHCNHLEELSLHINVEAIVTGLFQQEGWGDDLTRNPFSAFECPVYSIIFGPCPIPGERGATMFALTLLRLFPHLKSVAAFPRVPDEKFPLWEMVDSLVTTYRGMGTSLADIAAKMRD